MYQLISKETLKEWIASHEQFVLLDVRGEDEWKAGHIGGSVLMPHWFVALKIGDLVPDKNTKIVTYCLSGGRSSLAAKTLTDMGYANVWNLDGGYSAFLG
ncbi:MAG: rhodanese-like domain-containing protein [Candidatus Uhrbacteria bacterium]|nr:rhodanese-like domain-containing protein [Candidatus Uhrbacteria bacterium]